MWKEEKKSKSILHLTLQEKEALFFERHCKVWVLLEKAKRKMGQLLEEMEEEDFVV